MKYDVIVIGGGPAGMMAAGRAGELGARVLLLEKNQQLGRKLLITGGGRCNISNNIFNPKILADCFGDNGRFLISAFNKFGVKEIINFFNDHGVATKVEKDNQIFPVSNNANDALRALQNYLKESNVKIKFSSEVKKIVSAKNIITKIILQDGQELTADNFIMATGGKSYPATGATGDAYSWLKQLGHKIITPRPALTPIWLRENYGQQLEGLSLSQVRVVLIQNKKRIASLTGDIIFTSQGLSGPAIINISRHVKDLQKQESFLEIDFLPAINNEDLDKKLQLVFAANSNKLIKNILGTLVAPKLADLFVDLAQINQNKKSNGLTRDERHKIIKLLKSFELKIGGLGDFNKAIITAGGVDLKEIDPKSMRSKIISNLLVAGEILDIDGPTGGYNLQVCWSTGYVAGENSTEK